MMKELCLNKFKRNFSIGNKYSQVIESDKNLEWHICFLGAHELIVYLTIMASQNKRNLVFKLLRHKNIIFYLTLYLLN